MTDLAFIATQSAPVITSEAIIAAASGLGLDWTARPQGEPGGPLSFNTGRSTVMVMPIGAMHPDIPNMPVGPTGADPEELASTAGHIIVTALELESDQIDRDLEIAMYTAVVIEAVDAVGAMLAHNAYFHRADVFSQLITGATNDGHLPIPLLISVTVAGDGSGRMSFLSHRMERYGKENLYVTCSVEGTGAVPFTYDTLTWFFDLAEPLPTGDSIGRTEDEHILIQRVASPADPDLTVVRLDLD